MYKRLGKYNKAQYCSEHAIELLEKSHGKEHIVLSPLLVTLSGILGKRVLLEKSTEIAKRALAIAQNAKGQGKNRFCPHAHQMTECFCAYCCCCCRTF